VLSFVLGQSKAKRQASISFIRPHSLPHFYGLFVAFWTLFPALIWSLLILLISPAVVDTIVIKNTPAQAIEVYVGGKSFFLEAVHSGAFSDKSLYKAITDPVVQKSTTLYETLYNRFRLVWLCGTVLLIVCGLVESYRTIIPSFAARTRLESYAKWMLIACATTSILITISIAFSVLFESLRFFGMVPITEFLFGTQWSPQMALRADQAGTSGAFGMIPLFLGTLMITIIAMCVAVPVGLLSAIYMSEYASPRLRNTMKPVLEILAGIPTVVYGYFAIVTLSPLLRGFGESLGFTVASESALCAGLVMGIMIIPFVSSLSDDIITAVPRALRDASLALGATPSETIKKVVIPAALPGIVGAVLLAVSRAIGETMIVVMAAGLAANLTANPLEAVTTVTAQIVSLLVGDQEFDSPKTLAAFALGLTLFVITLVLNVIALMVVKKYREKYD
jgi:phosphate transport system permease protein